MAVIIPKIPEVSIESLDESEISRWSLAVWNATLRSLKYKSIVKRAFLLREPRPYSPTAETALQPLIRCFRSRYNKTDYNNDLLNKHYTLILAGYYNDLLVTLQTDYNNDLLVLYTTDNTTTGITYMTASGTWPSSSATRITWQFK